MTKQILKSFFKTDPAYNIGFARILFFGALLRNMWASDYFVESFYFLQQLPKEFWTPTGVFKILPPPPLYFSLEEVYILQNIMCLSLFFCMIGFLTRFSATCSFLLMLMLLGYSRNFGHIYDGDSLLLVTLFVLIFSNMNSHLSIDNLLKKNLANKKFVLLGNLWTLKIITTLTCLFYFTSGIQKLRLSGLDFVFSDHLAISLFYMGHPLGVFLSQFSLVCKSLGFLSLLLQLVSFVPIFRSRFTNLFLLLFVLFHITIDITLGNHFRRHFLVLVFLVPWGDLIPSLSGRLKGDFSSSLLKFYKEMKLKEVLQMGLWLLVGAFVIGMSLYAPYSLKHIYPFSTTTMYAFKYAIPYKKRMLVLHDKFGKERPITPQELFPLKNRIYGRFLRLEKQPQPVAKTKQILEKLREPPFNKWHSLKEATKISLKHCFWKTTKDYASRPKKPDTCKTFAEKIFK